MATVTVVPTVEAAAGNLPPRVRLDITASGTPTITATTITRLDPDGRLVPVRTATGDPLVLTGTTGLVYDYEAWFGQPVYYSSLESPTVVSSAVTVDESRIWLIHPGIPTLSRPITVQLWGARTRRAQQGVFWPMGRSTPVVHTDGQRKSAEYGLTLLTQTLQEAADLEALVDDTSPLLLNVPPAQASGVGAEYVSIADVTPSRIARVTANPMRSWEMACTVVRRPEGGSQATRTYVDVIADNASYAIVLANYPTYAALLAGP